MPLVLRKFENETWLEAALRRADEYELGGEVLQAYDAGRKNGESEADAAWGACYEWDVLEYREEMADGDDAGAVPVRRD